ncbi:succinate dehydrogenase [bacterium]|nr:succinate dehydrogenase [bacterium]
MTNTQYFLLRRLHSLLGVIPLGLFLFAHMTTNSMAFFGQGAFEHKVALIHSLGPMLPFVEAAMIFIPLCLHIALGIWIALTAKSNIGRINYGRNWAYTMQRWSGWAAFAFLAYHAIWLRILDKPNGQYYTYLVDLFQNPLWVLIYLVGSAAVIYHFANGLCTFCMTWGITVGPRSQKWMAIIALFVGLGLMGMMMASLYGFTFGAPDVVHTMPVIH